MRAPLQSAEPSEKAGQPRSSRLAHSRQIAIFKALADPHRFELLRRIARAGCPLACSDARAALAISAATLSHHVKELDSAGLINVRREGKFAYLSLRPGVLTGLAQVLGELETAACAPR